MPRTNALASRVKTTGDTMTGELDVTGSNIVLDNGHAVTGSGGTTALYFGFTGSYLAVGTGAVKTTYATISNGNLIFPIQAPTASAPSYVLGGMYFDTTLGKMRIGGATAWETVTSV